LARNNEPTWIGVVVGPRLLQDQFRCLGCLTCSQRGKRSCRTGRAGAADGSGAPRLAIRVLARGSRSFVITEGRNALLGEQNAGQGITVRGELKTKSPEGDTSASQGFFVDHTRGNATPGVPCYRARPDVHGIGPRSRQHMRGGGN
jgi:hypothetical protein